MVLPIGKFSYFFVLLNGTSFALQVLFQNNLNARVGWHIDTQHLNSESHRAEYRHSPQMDKTVRNQYRMVNS